MAQTDKAKENQVAQKEAPQLTQEVLVKLLEPMQETISQLKASNEEKEAAKIAQEEAVKQAAIDKDADIAAMLKEGNVDTGQADDSYEQLSKRQIVDVIAGAVETALAANATKIKADISQSMVPGAEKVDKIEKAVMGILGHMEVEETRGKHSDFDEYKDGIAKIMGENPGLTFERAYLVAKSEAAGSVPPKSQIETEKPSDSNEWRNEDAPTGGAIPNQNALQAISDRGREAREDAAVTKSGTVGIRNIISEGVDRMQAGKQQQQ